MERWLQISARRATGGGDETSEDEAVASAAAGRRLQYLLDEELQEESSDDDDEDDSPPPPPPFDLRRTPAAPKLEELALVLALLACDPPLIAPAAVRPSMERRQTPAAAAAVT